ncbi:MAG: hypothetical protein ACLFV3_10400 [Phycisphaeraceae bacterium]
MTNDTHTHPDRPTLDQLRDAITTRLTDMLTQGEPGTDAAGRNIRRPASAATLRAAITWHARLSEAEASAADP